MVYILSSEVVLKINLCYLFISLIKVVTIGQSSVMAIVLLLKTPLNYSDIACEILSPSQLMKSIPCL